VGPRACLDAVAQIHGDSTHKIRFVKGNKSMWFLYMHNIPRPSL